MLLLMLLLLFVQILLKLATLSSSMLMKKSLVSCERRACEQRTFHAIMQSLSGLVCSGKARTVNSCKAYTLHAYVHGTQQTGIFTLSQCNHYFLIYIDSKTFYSTTLYPMQPYTITFYTINMRYYITAVFSFKC